jgi:hypothetical protein
VPETTGDLSTSAHTLSHDCPFPGTQRWAWAGMCNRAKAKIDPPMAATDAFILLMTRPLSKLLLDIANIGQLRDDQKSKLVPVH